jgi:putative membrane-bound dehydrogenase-like protein
MRLLALAVVAALVVAPPVRGADYAVGIAQVDITPTYPVRLSGFGFRRTESEGVTQKIWAKALALGDDNPAVLIAVDNLGVPSTIVDEVARRLAPQGIKRDRLAITATHTHTAPMLTNVCPTLFGVPIPKEHQEHIDRYTKEFTDALKKVALAALADRRPAKLSWGVGTVGFAANRRTKGGPVDHDLPVLVVRDDKGQVRAVYVSYACHCVTLSNNKVSGDWAGYAQQAIQDDCPGAVALCSIGCGADSNPSSGVTGDKVELAQRQGAAVAAEVKRLLKGYLAPVTGPLTTKAQTIELPLADLPTKADWQERAKRKDAVGYHAQVQLAKLDRGESLRTKIDYPVMTWAFDSLAMVFLPGEVVVDYSLRLKKELDARRLWVNAYANDAPCYIPSERVLKEGGYEGGGAMVYYDVPGPFKPGLEQKIIDAVHEQIGKRFATTVDPNKTGGARPLSPQQSLAALRTKKGLAVDLVAAEPLVASPVAIDFGPDGRLWVAEMYDYPSGLDGKFKPGGRVRVLDDTDGDGIFDKSTVFLDNIPFPTGLIVWRKGVLVCAAPDILYAEDTDGDGKADVVRKLYSGFGTDNYQARVNSLQYGLDGWVYGSCGLFGGKITSHLTGKTLNLGDRDFRIKPDTGEIEPATGRTQQGRVRNDWGDWFGCDNSELCRHYVLADHYLRRNPHVAFTDTAVHIPDYPDWNRLYPARQVQLFKLSGPPNRVTSACGIGVYRDDLLGQKYQGDVFTCEPVNLVVTRLKPTPKGSTFSGRRAEDEQQSEFLASTDNWFRPVQARTGPDGALWVVDMYRYVIEHPRWIPPEDLKNLDVRAGHDRGRIYRVRPADGWLRLAPRLDKLDAAGLVAALDNPNGTVRDLATQMLLWRDDKSAAPALEKMAMEGTRPEARLHALCALDGLGKLSADVIRKALGDQQAGVRRGAARLSEKFLADRPEVGAAVAKLTEDADAQVRLQVAYSLGAWRDPRAGQALAALALKYADDRHLVAAVMSGVDKDNVADVLALIFGEKVPPDSLVRPLIETATALEDKNALAQIFKRVTTRDKGSKPAAWQLTALAELLEALARRKLTLDMIANRPTRFTAQFDANQIFNHAVVMANDGSEADANRIAAVRLVGAFPRRSARTARTTIELLVGMLAPRNSADLQSAVLAALGRMPEAGAADLLKGWNSYAPSLKSQILDHALGRDDWRDELLLALEKGTVPPGQIDAAHRQRLLTHKSEEVRRRAAKVFEGATSADRQKVLKDYAEVASLKGDATRGKAVFAKTCSVCHRLEGVGHEVGPDLAALANKSAAYLLQEILDPNRNVDSRYVEYVAQMKNGRAFNGLLAAETATSITLRGQEGKEQVLLRTDIEELSSNGKSLMPEGLEKDLRKPDMADLLAYLGGLGSRSSVRPEK